MNIAQYSNTDVSNLESGDKLDITYAYINIDAVWVKMHASGHLVTFIDTIEDGDVYHYLVLRDGLYTLQFINDGVLGDIIEQRSFGLDDAIKIDLIYKLTIVSERLLSKTVDSLAAL